MLEHLDFVPRSRWEREDGWIRWVAISCLNSQMPAAFVGAGMAQADKPYVLYKRYTIWKIHVWNVLNTYLNKKITDLWSQIIYGLNDAIELIRMRDFKFEWSV